MRRSPQVVTLVAMTLGITIALTSGVRAAGPAASPLASHLAFELDIAPQAGSADTFMLTATLKDLDSGKPISSPRVQFKKGQPASVRTSVASDTAGQPLDVVIAVGIDESGQKATCTSEVRAGGQLISSQRIAVTLPRT